ncbi:hypothetical protein FWF89_01375 [Candidatus Saccharibacteria bacterium]|jgi:hypothetical protein|nr:hypothetical protein [Candidatus Saccharibacteria bacterium]
MFGSWSDAVENALKRFFVTKAFVRAWMARTFLYRRNNDKHEFSRLLSPTLNELYYLMRDSEKHMEFQLFLIDCRNKVGHHGKYELRASR